MPRPAPGRRLTAVLAATALATGTLAALASTSTAAPVPGTAVSGEVDRTAEPRRATGAPAPVFSAGKYVVTLADAPAATYTGGVAGYRATKPRAGQKLATRSADVRRYRALLRATQDRKLRAVGARASHRYTVATNGFAAQLSAKQAAVLARTPGVVSVVKDQRRTLDTTYSPEFLGLSARGGLWSRLGGDRRAGRGVIVGVLDSGIWPESPSFAGRPVRVVRGQPVPISGVRAPWNGICQGGEEFSSFTCNSKLVGARYYVAGFGAGDVSDEDYLSPRDGDGHGSHTASTAAGNRVRGVRIDGVRQGTASGMAPGAMVAAYKICWTGKPDVAADGCFDSDSVAAIDDAVADGVDVINYSVGGSSESSPLDPVQQAFLRAAAAGVYVAASAGNSGPGASTLDNTSPWLTTVAASTFRIAEKVAQLGNGARYVGASTTPPLPRQTPLVRSVSVRTASATERDAALCLPGTLDPARTAGRVVQCDRGVNPRIEKSFVVEQAGGVGMILTNTGPNSLNGDYHLVPTVHVDDVARAAILAYIASTPNPTAAILPTRPGESDTRVPEVVAFSSRGPSTATGGDVLKPDLSAPGVDVLAAVAPPFNYGRSYDYLSGTSMSSPHVAGLGALLRAAHPDWSPAAVKSALMTTARDHASTDDPFAQGAGFVVPNRAVDPGLVLDAGTTDWLSYMAGLGAELAPPFDRLRPISGADLNQPSIAVGALAGTQTVTRTFRNVSRRTETYRVTASVPGLRVTPSRTTLRLAPGRRATVRFALERTSAEIGSWTTGHLTMTGNRGHVVRLPVAVRPVAVKAPAEISGTGASGSRTFTVVPGTTGPLDLRVVGLVGATPQVGQVGEAPFDPAAPAVGPGTRAYPVDVPAGTTLARFDLDSLGAGDDLDLWVYRDGQLVDLSATAAGDEQVTLVAPAPGRYTVYVNGFGTPGGGRYAFTSWVVGTADAGNLRVTPDPAPGVAGRPLQLTATWSGLSTTRRWLGWIGYGDAEEVTIVSIG